MATGESTCNRKRGRPRLDDLRGSTVTSRRRLWEELVSFTAGDSGSDLNETPGSEHTQQDPVQDCVIEVTPSVYWEHSQSDPVLLNESARGQFSASDQQIASDTGSEQVMRGESVDYLSEARVDQVNSSAAKSGTCSFETGNSDDDSCVFDVPVDFHPAVYSCVPSDLGAEPSDVFNTGVLSLDCDECLQCTCVSCDICAHHDEGECVHCDICGDTNSECSDAAESFYSCFDVESEEVLSAEDTRNAAIKKDFIDIALKHNLTHAVIQDIMLFCRKYQFGSFPRCASSLLQTSHSSVTQSVPPGEYWHNGLTDLVKDHVDKYKCEHVEVEFSVDGLPISNSSNSSFWPILCSFNESPEVHLVGSYCGVSKPSDPNVFLKEFVEEIAQLCDEGLVHDGRKISVSCAKFIADTPARNFVLNVKGHTSYCGCHKCMVQGEMCDRRMAFIDSDARLRSDEDFVNRVQYDYHKEGGTIVEKIPKFGPVSCVPLDYMHLILLGIMKKLLLLWMQGPLAVRLPANTVLALSESLVQLSPWVPKEFVRKTRSLQFVKRFKATEFRMLLLYVFPVILKGKLPRKLFQHFLILHVAVVIMIDPTLCAVYLDEAREYCEYFVETFKDLYGCQFVSYNVHALIHIADDAKKYGALDRFSAFKYENFLQSLLKIIHRGRKPLQQLASRYSEFGRFRTSKQTRQVDVKSAILSGLHSNGPLPRDCIGPQSKVCKLPGYEVNLSDANNCVILDSGSIVVVKNFARDRAGRPVLIGRKFLNASDLYTEPAPSSLLDIYRVDTLSELQVWPVSSIDRKCFRMPLDDGFAIVPLRHSAKQ